MKKFLFLLIFLQTFLFNTANAEIKIYTGSDIYIMSESDNLGSAKEKESHLRRKCYYDQWNFGNFERELYHRRRKN